MTTRINLIPWRELRRREQDRQLLSASVGTWILMGLIVFYAQWHMADQIQHQKDRNTFVKSEISKLEKQIAEIEELKKQREALLARMEIIQQLQRDRTQIVHVFDDLVRKLPKGVYFTQLEKRGQGITVKGVAQSNARVSALMQNLDSSEWFTNPNLDIINVAAQGGSRRSSFTLKVTQQTKGEQPQTTASQGNTGKGKG